jgi:hypothetical protein
MKIVKLEIFKSFRFVAFTKYEKAPAFGHFGMARGYCDEQASRYETDEVSE